MELDFAQRLKNYRRAKDLTQRELAEAIGVSDKTVSRWESGGGYPDVPVLVPLAEALGVTVDDLLNDQRPIRTLTKTDAQNLLSFAFALGGGVLFFLLKLFVPALLCYLAYLGCLAYGVYLQKYYAYQSRWFLLGEAVVNFGVNFSVLLPLVAYQAVFSIQEAISQGGAVSPGVILRSVQWWYLLEKGIMAALAAGVLTALTQYVVWKKGFQTGAGLDWRTLRLGWARPPLGRLIPALLPPLAGLYWIPALWTDLAPQAPDLFFHQDALFALWLCVLALVCSLPLLKKGFRRWIAPVWLLAGLCWGMTGLRFYGWMWGSGRLWPYSSGPLGTGRFVAVGWGTWGTALLALALAAAWVAVSCLYLRRTEAKEPGQTDEGP